MKGIFQLEGGGCKEIWNFLFSIKNGLKKHLKFKNFTKIQSIKFFFIIFQTFPVSLHWLINYFRILPSNQVLVIFWSTLVLDQTLKNSVLILTWTFSMEMMK